MKRRIILNLSELEIQGNSNGTIHIKWSPKEAGCWRDILQLTDNRRIKYDIIIMTIAKVDKSNKVRRKLKPAISNSSNISTSMANKQFQNNPLKVSTIDQSLGNNFGTQIKQCKSKCENDLNKENILNKNETKTYASQAKNRINGMCHNGHEKLENVLCEQNINVWSDSSVLPQVLLPSNVPQDIRRTTYIKERKPCSSILYEEVNENMESDKDKAQSDFSILLNKFTFTSTDVIASSPEPARRESTESTTSQITDKHRTFNISHGQFFETSAIYDTKAPVNAASVLQPCLHNLSPIKSDGCSLITDIKDLISSSPIQFQHHIPKEPNEYTKHFTVDINPNIQTSNYEYFTFEVIPKNVTAKKTEDMYIEISPPKNFRSKMVSMSVSKLNSARAGRITKNNALYEDGNRKKLQLTVSATSELCFFKKIVFSIILILTYVL